MKSTSGIHGAPKAPLAQGLCRHRENLGSLPDPRSNSFSRLAACMDWTAFAAASCQFQLDVAHLALAALATACQTARSSCFFAEGVTLRVWGSEFQFRVPGSGSDPDLPTSRTFPVAWGVGAGIRVMQASCFTGQSPLKRKKEEQSRKVPDLNWFRC